MAFDEGLAQRVLELLEKIEGFSEKKMFGGMCYLLNGNMVCGVIKDELMVRVGKENYAEAVALPHAREMDFTGRPVRGMIYVDVDGIETDADLECWVSKGLDYASSLPPK